MSAKPHESRKVVIVGAGAVGSTFAYALSREGTADEIVLTDLDEDLAEGQALDLAHGLPFIPRVLIRAGDQQDYEDASVIVITAGASQKPGESRLELTQRNTKVVQAVMDDITASKTGAVVVVVTNPVDVLTYTAIENSGWDDGRLLGSGTVLDTARLRYLISHSSGVNVKNVHAYVLGEHGDSEIAAWSITNIAGMPIDEFCPVCGVCPEGEWDQHKEDLQQRVRDSAYHIIDYKGATNFGVGLALVRIVGTILRNEHRVLTVSTILRGEYDMRDVCLSVPCIVSASGVEKIIEMSLSDKDLTGLRASGEVLREQIARLAETRD